MHSSIFIDGNDDFNQTAIENGWEGDGSFNDPYIIEDYIIYATNDHGIEIKNTDVYFIIKNTTVLNGRSEYNFGFYFDNMSHGHISDNTAKDNLAGFLFRNCQKNNLTRNIAKNCVHGIRVQYSFNNTILNNTDNYNAEYGIYLDNISNETIAKNTLINNSANYNNINGFYLKNSANNTLINNTANYNAECGFYLINITDNILTRNNATNNLRNGFYLTNSNGNSLTDNKANFLPTTNII